MVAKDTIRNLRPGYRLTIKCDGAADLDSTYQTAWRTRKEMGISKEVMIISRLAPSETVIVEYKKGGFE